MNIYQLAHNVNNRMFGGSEDKFNIVFIIIGEILYAYKLCFGTQHQKNYVKDISLGELDNIIMEIIKFYCVERILCEDGDNTWDMLPMVDFFHKKFKVNFRYK